mgnify:CR=1 FL=1
MKFGIVGYGKMSSAIARAAKGYFEKKETQLYVYTPSAMSAKQAREDLGHVRICEDMEELCRESNLILFGVKPQILLNLLNKYAEQLKGKAVLSIAAGITSRSIFQAVGEMVEVQRIMPNLGALVSRGMTLLSEETTLSDLSLEYVQELFATIGKVKVLPESLMDIGSVISGSSGAFYTLFLEGLAEAGLRRGLSYQDAIDMALQSHLGAILQLQEGLDSGKLRIETSSPAGTTIEGVIALEKAGLRSALHEAVEASFRRCVELSKQ